MRRCAIGAGGVIFDISSSPGGVASVMHSVLRLNGCLWTRMGMLFKASTKKHWSFESCQRFSSLAANLRGRNVLANTRGFISLPPVAFAFAPSTQRDWGLSPTELWASMHRFKCWLSQLPLLERSNFILTAPNVRGRPADFYGQSSPELAVMGCNA